MELIVKNTHNLDRIVRVALGLGLLSLAFVGPRTPWGYAGLILVLTGLSGTCPIYRILGISTCPVTPSPKTN
jgi:Protein of unknown function (DUF2892)